MPDLNQSLTTQEYYGNWGLVIVSILIFSFFLAFIPFHRRAQRRPASIYLAFITASAFEMYGIPLSMYFVAWAFGLSLPEGVFWGHTLKQYIGYWGILLALPLYLAGADLVIRGWEAIHKNYWGKERGERRLVTEGVYSYMRHPQYTGFMLLTLGLIVHWATLLLIIMWPILAFQYYRLAKREEAELEEEFGEEYIEYRRRVPMFIPSLNRFLGRAQ